MSGKSKNKHYNLSYSHYFVHQYLSSMLVQLHVLNIITFFIPMIHSNRKTIGQDILSSYPSESKWHIQSRRSKRNSSWSEMFVYNVIIAQLFCIKNKIVKTTDRLYKIKHNIQRFKTTHIYTISSQIWNFHFWLVTIQTNGQHLGSGFFIGWSRLTGWLIPPVFLWTKPQPTRKR